MNKYLQMEVNREKNCGRKQLNCENYCKLNQISLVPCNYWVIFVGINTFLRVKDG